MASLLRRTLQLQNIWHPTYFGCIKSRSLWIEKFSGTILFKKS